MITEQVRATNGRMVESLKSQYFVDSIKLAHATSKLAPKENNDCVVRAFMCALDIPYEQAHAWVKKELKRQDRKGTFVHAYGKKISFIGSHPSRNMKHLIGSDKVLSNTKYKKATGYTLKSFMENNPVGRFVLIVQGHAVAVCEGVLCGNTSEKYNGLYRSVWFGFECK
jgi:hypothetical protein